MDTAATPNYLLIRLETPRLVMRPLELADVPDAFALFSDPRVMRYWSSGPWPSLEFAEAFIARERIEMAAGEHVRLGIRFRDAPELLGTCSLFGHVPQSRRAEVGYALRPFAWGRGVVQEAMTALLDYGFGTLDLNRAEAEIDPRNLTSARSLERLGFTREGLQRERWIVDGEVSDSALYGLLRSDWTARRA